MTIKSSYHAWPMRSRRGSPAGRIATGSKASAIPQTGSAAAAGPTSAAPNRARRPRAPPKPRTNARERLLDALERLIDARDFAALTADPVATEAGLAHGTFYRHFRDKRDALRAALERVRKRRGPVVEALRDDAATGREARAGIGAHGRVGSALAGASTRRSCGLLRAGGTRPELARERRERKARIARAHRRAPGRAARARAGGACAIPRRRRRRSSR